MPRRPCKAATRGWAARAYVAAHALVMGGLDYLWLANTSGPIYHRALGAVMADSPNMTAAVAFYLIHILGILCFAVRCSASSPMPPVT